MAKQDSKVKINIKKSKQDKSDVGDLSGPMMDDIHQKSSRWKKLPVKNVVKIKDKQGSKTNNKFLLRSLLVLSVLVVVAAGLFALYYFKYSVASEKAAKLVPYESSIFGKIKLSKILTLADTQEPISLDGEMDFVGNYISKNVNEEIFNYGLDFSNDVKSILGGDLFFAFMENGEESGFVFINQVRDLSLAKNNLENTKYKSQLEEENYGGATIYIISDESKENSVYITFLEDYMAASKKRTCITAIIDTYQNKRLNLSQNKEFQSTLPLFLSGEIAYVYLEPGIISSISDQDSKFMMVWSALMSKMNSAFFVLKDKDNGIILDANIKGEDQNGDKKIKKELIELLPAETSGFIAGNDLSSDIEEFKADVSKSSPPLEFYLSEILRNLGEKTKADESELLSFLNDDYILSFDYTGDKVNYNLIFKYENEGQAAVNMEDFEEAASNYFGTLHPKFQKMILSDGTEADELMPDPESFRFSDIDFEGKKARSIESQVPKYNISYVADEDIIIISTSLGSLKNILSADSANDKLTNKRYFSYPYSQVSGSGVDSMLYFDNKDLQDYFKFDNLFGKVVSLFDNITVSVGNKNGKTNLKSFFYLE